ncbi:hypothetical protein M569_11501 [Genlisea aurea]|uniref:DCL protein n=1 Tax=Genlisea aurea TaxID=192259 RepID=S8DK51_9LAMI|nr:hypothetical protein M569_11501 [Genlisea aurea]
MAAASILLRPPLPSLRLHLFGFELSSPIGNCSVSSSQLCSAAADSAAADGDYRSPNCGSLSIKPCKESSSAFLPRLDDPEFRKWKRKEAEILGDIEPLIRLTKDILHSDRYFDGERLSAVDEKAVVDNLLAYHPHSGDKIGCGLDSIMVDRHPWFRQSRCLFVVRTDGVWIDFSYQKCLRAYIRHKYPSQAAERFIREHFKRGT